MKKILIILALFAASGTMTTQAQYRQTETVWGANDGSIQRDERGEYRWEMRERRVWIPEQRTRGILGVGGRTIPGHYEMRTERVKVYRNSQQNNNKKKGHPHGMPPGQRKKMDNRDNDRYDSRDRRYEGQDRRYDGRDRDNDNRRDRDDDRRRGRDDDDRD